MSVDVAAPMRVRIDGAFTVPQVNLLPPEVRRGRALSKVKSWLGVALLGVVVLIGLAYVWALWSQKVADQDLADVLDQNTQIVNQQAQYAEVPQVLGQIDGLTTARSEAMAAETLWQPFMSAVAALTPTEVSIDTMTITTDTPWVASVAAPTAPLATAETVGQIAISGRAVTVPDTAAWEDSLSELPGVVDIEVTSVSITEDDGSPYYAIVATMKVTSAAYSDRFALEAN